MFTPVKVKMLNSSAPRLSFSNTSGAQEQSKPSTGKKAMSYEVQQGVAIIKFHSPPVNALGKQFCQELQENVVRAFSDSKAKALVLSSAIPKVFVAGADINDLVENQQPGAKDPFKNNLSFNEFANTLENGPKPTVAAIDGLALGGGLEVAMACNRRISTQNGSFGLPELTLGIIPGLGGTQRLPRLIGVQKSLEMMLTSRPISTKDALSLKLIDQVVASDQLIPQAIQLALEMVEGTKSRTKALQLRTRLEPPHVLSKIFEAAEKKLDPRLPQQSACVKAVKAGLEFDGLYGLITENKEFAKCGTSPTAKALCHFFLSERATTKIPGVQIAKDGIKSVGIIGGGTMGSGIAIACLQAGIKVILKEVNQKFLDVGLGRIRSVFDSRLQRKRISQEAHAKATSLLSGQIDYSNFDKLDMVVEAVLEQIPLKQQVFGELEKHCSSTCILATNTSTIDIDEIGKNTKAQDRIIGLHFFSPAYIMPLLEIIRTKKTSSECLGKSLKFSQQIKKTPVVVLNEIGFAVNRIFLPYFMSSGLLVDLGMDPYKIDSALQKFGFAVGPFRTADIAGLDVGKFSRDSQSKLFKDRMYSSDNDSLLLKEKRLGEKTGSGYYLYKGDGDIKKPVQDPELSKYFEEGRRNMKLKPLQNQSNFSDEDIQLITLLPAVNEACRVIEEGLVYRVSDIDVAGAFGMNFPRMYGGLVKWADEFVGAKKVVERLEDLQKQTGLRLYEPCQYLKDCAANGKSLESGL
ncbi:enoyl-CoA hydratase/3 hydroxyacyl-CoA dehydrogenase [Acrasis kona]|uniref:Enoyl-CoA hydratase/3 hydroxyacyl-CoA dehydrogenase n=1 Tax=Acrasis kona TaxID=1008807 RepID=A0AAW2ZQN4_9EUKA